MVSSFTLVFSGQSKSFSELKFPEHCPTICSQHMSIVSPVIPSLSLVFSGHCFSSPLIITPNSVKSLLLSVFPLHLPTIGEQPVGALKSPPLSKHVIIGSPMYLWSQSRTPRSLTVVPDIVGIIYPSGAPPGFVILKALHVFSSHPEGWLKAPPWVRHNTLGIPLYPGAHVNPSSDVLVPDRVDYPLLWKLTSNIKKIISSNGLYSIEKLFDNYIYQNIKPYHFHYL